MIENFSNINTDNFIYANSIGVVFKEKIIIIDYNKRIPIHISRINDIIIEKKRSYLFNYYLLIFSVFLSLIFYSTFINQTFILKIISLLIILMSFCFSIFYKKYKYSLYILLKNSENIIIKLNDKNKNCAKEILRDIKRRLKEINNKILK